MLNKSLFLITAIAAILFTGCGYTTTTLLPDTFRTIKVANFTNAIDITKEISDKRDYQVYIPGLEIQVTKEIIDRYIFDGNLKVMTEGPADAILSGEVIDYRKDPLRYTDDDDIDEYRVSVVINMKLVDQHTGEIMWEEPSFIGESTFRLSGQFARSESAARKEALEDLAVRVVERTVEVW